MYDVLRLKFFVLLLSFIDELVVISLGVKSPFFGVHGSLGGRNFLLLNELFGFLVNESACKPDPDPNPDPSPRPSIGPSGRNVGECVADGIAESGVYAGEKQSHDGELQVSSSKNENGDPLGLSVVLSGISK